MRSSVITIFFIFLILCNKNSAQGALITADVTQHPISLTANQIWTWDINGVKVFWAKGDVKIEQGSAQIIANSVAAWFTKVDTAQLIEGHMEIYCEGNVSLFQEGIIENYEQIYLRLVTSAGIVVNPVKVPIKSFEEEQKTEVYLRGKKIRAEGREEFAAKEEPEVGPPVSISAEGEPIDIFADDIDTWIEKDVRVVVAIGNVRIKRGDETLNADNAILHLDQEKSEKDKPLKLIYKEMYAEGNVTLIREGDLIIAEKVFENIKEEKGIFVNSTISSVLRPPIVKLETPVYIDGAEIKRKGKGQYDVSNGRYSLCSYGHPHFYFKSSRVRIFKTAEHSIASAKKNIFYAGNIPLVYLPVLSFDLKRRAKLLEDWETGTTSRFGRFVKTDWDVYSIAFGEKMDDWSDLTLSADFLSLRGPALGLDFEYAKPNYSGYMNTYYIRDGKATDINSVPVPQKNREQFLWRHRQFLAYDWRADIEISHVSDRSFFREYFEQELKTEKDRETIIYLRKISDNRGITFLAEHQLRTFDTLVNSERLNRKNESLPELKYSIIGEPLWGGKLNFTSEAELAFQNRVFDRISPEIKEQFLGRGALLTAERVFDRVPVRLEPKETIRFDTNHMLNAPFRILGVRFNPFIDARFTAYSESVRVNPITQGNEGDGASRGRILGSLGLNTSITLSRTYSIYNKLLNINRLRHIMIPELRLNFTPIATQNPEDLNQFDGIDALDNFKSIVLRLHNRFQTKRGETGEETPVDLIDFDIAFNLFPGNAGLNRKRDDFIGLDIKMELTDKISLLSERNEFNLGKGGVDILNFGLNYKVMPNWNFFLGNRFIDDFSSSVIFSSGLSLGEKWQLALYEQFDFKAKQKASASQPARTESQNLARRFVVSRFFHDWIVNIIINESDTRGDTTTSFDIIPRGAAGRVGGLRSRFQSVSAFLPQPGP
ncbi:MAG: LPS assembly protein LptD [Candidatus Scalinduaceae bacterium]